MKTPILKIKLINHSQIIDAKYLPTFNSHVIEANLYKIPDLSEHFIYFNDDVFVARPLMPNHFFENNGLASLFVANKSFQKNTSTGSNHTDIDRIRTRIKALKKTLSDN